MGVLVVFDAPKNHQNEVFFMQKPEVKKKTELLKLRLFTDKL